MNVQKTGDIDRDTCRGTRSCQQVQRQSDRAWPTRGLCLSVTSGDRRLRGWRGRAGFQSEVILNRERPRSFVHLESSLLGQQVDAMEAAGSLCVESWNRDLRGTLLDPDPMPGRLPGPLLPHSKPTR